MCGRYKIVTDAQALYDAFQVQAELEAAPLARYNVAPATDQLVILCEAGRRVARWHRWGLIPSWAKDKAIGYKTINARGESVAAKPAFRAALRQRRCLVPATGFYEWKVEDGGKQPYLVRLRSGELFAFAGLWENWTGPEGEVRSFTIITTEPNALMARIHDRMPAIIPRAVCALARSCVAGPGADPADDRKLSGRGIAGYSGRPPDQQRAQPGAGADSAGGSAARVSLPLHQPGWQRLEWRHVAFDI